MGVQILLEWVQFFEFLIDFNGMSTSLGLFYALVYF